jgi:uncharacterized protein (DUF433 family)
MSHRIISDPAAMMGKPVVEGTRIAVELILEKLAAGESAEQILEDHPRLTRESIASALEFAAPSSPDRTNDDSWSSNLRSGIIGPIASTRVRRTRGVRAAQRPARPSATPTSAITSRD